MRNLTAEEYAEALWAGAESRRRLRWLAQVKKWGINHPDQILAKSNKWKLANRDLGRAYLVRWRAANPDKLAAIQHRRYAHRKTAKIENFTLDDVIARDGPNCGICGVEIDLTLKGRSGDTKSLDHIIPLARGGAHTLSNSQLAHMRCNSAKGAR